MTAWLQLGISLRTRPTSAFWTALADTVEQARQRGWLQRWSLQAKEPGLRIRMQSAPTYSVRLLADLQRMVTAIERSEQVRNYRYNQYEPEELRFGGPWGMELFWDDADRDSDLAVAHHLLCSGVRPSHVLALASARDLIMRATPDAGEEWDVWARVAPPPEVASPPIADAETLLAASTDLHRLEGLLPAPIDGLIGRVRQANTLTCAGLSALTNSGLLAIGPRAWLTAVLPFRLNRWGFGPHTAWVLRAVADAGAPHE